MDNPELLASGASALGDTPKKPLLLLDIDGALSPYIKIGEDGADDLWWVTGREGVAPQLPAWLDRLSQSFDLVWAASREDESNEIFGPAIGLGVLPVIHFTRGAQDDTAKLSNVLEFVGDRSFAWVDDDLFDDAYYAAQRHPSPVLLIRTRRLVGITHEHVAQLLKFARELSAPTDTTPTCL